MKTIKRALKTAIPIVLSVLVASPFAQTLRNSDIARNDSYRNLSFSSGFTNSVEKVSAQVGITPNDYTQTNAFYLIDNNQDGRFTSADSLYSIIERHVNELGKTINLTSQNPKIMSTSDAFKLYLGVAIDYLSKKGKVTGLPKEIRKNIVEIDNPAYSSSLGTSNNSIYDEIGAIKSNNTNREKENPLLSLDRKLEFLTRCLDRYKSKKQEIISIYKNFLTPIDANDALVSYFSEDIEKVARQRGEDNRKKPKQKVSADITALKGLANVGSIVKAIDAEVGLDIPITHPDGSTEYLPVGPLVTNGAIGRLHDKILGIINYNRPSDVGNSGIQTVPGGAVQTPSPARSQRQHTQESQGSYNPSLED